MIEEVCNDIAGVPAFLQKLSAAAHAFRHRLQLCIDIGGRQVESVSFVMLEGPASVNAKIQMAPQVFE
jgi:hypothetical protein